MIRPFYPPTAQLPGDLPTLAALYRDTLREKRVLILADDAKDEAQVKPLVPPPPGWSRLWPAPSTRPTSRGSCIAT